MLQLMMMMMMLTMTMTTTMMMMVVAMMVVVVVVVVMMDQWVDLTDRISADRTWYEWKTASRGATYHFRVVSYDGDAFSEPSPSVVFHTGGLSVYQSVSAL